MGISSDRKHASSLLSRGGVDARVRKTLRSLLSPRRRGGVGQDFLTSTYPVRSKKVASRLFLSVAVHPSSAEEGKSRGHNPRLQFVSCYNRWFA
jgi:hypothetical protein